MLPREKAWRDYLRKKSPSHSNYQPLSLAEEEYGDWLDGVWDEIEYPDAGHWNSYLNERFNTKRGLLISPIEFAHICEAARPAAGERPSTQAARIKAEMHDLRSKMGRSEDELARCVEENSEMHKDLRSIVYKLATGKLSHKELLAYSKLVSTSTVQTGSRVSKSKRRPPTNKKPGRKNAATAPLQLEHTGPSSRTRSRKRERHPPS